LTRSDARRLVCTPAGSGGTAAAFIIAKAQTVFVSAVVGYVLGGIAGAGMGFPLLGPAGAEAGADEERTAMNGSESEGKPDGRPPLRQQAEMIKERLRPSMEAEGSWFDYAMTGAWATIGAMVLTPWRPPVWLQCVFLGATLFALICWTIVKTLLWLGKIRLDGAEDDEERSGDR
jgi:hypothetical protein